MLLQRLQLLQLRSGLHQVLFPLLDGMLELLPPQVGTLPLLLLLHPLRPLGGNPLLCKESFVGGRWLNWDWLLSLPMHYE
jgi:hypothetical protein